MGYHVRQLRRELAEVSRNIEGLMHRRDEIEIDLGIERDKLALIARRLAKLETVNEPAPGQRDLSELRLVGPEDHRMPP